MDLLNTTIIVVSLVVLLATIYFYDKGHPLKRKNKIGHGVWRNSTFGKNFMLQKIGFILFIFLAASIRIFGEYPGSEWLKLTVYVYLFILFTSTLVDIVRTQSPKFDSLVKKVESILNRNKK